MTFSLSLATEEDIPGLIAVWNSAFWQESVRAVFPDTPTGRAWRATSFERSIRTPAQHCTHMIITEDSEDGKEKAKIVSYSRYFRYAEGEFDTDWKTRWEPTLAEDMKVELVDDAFFSPMAKQHRAVMESRAHYCSSLFLPVSQLRPDGCISELTGSSS
jgi:hypothetical protein